MKQESAAPSPPLPHTPVLLKEVLSVFSGSDRLLLDCTFGRGGHSAALLKAFPSLNILALDRDEEAIAFGQKHSLFKERIKIQKANFYDFPQKFLQKNDSLFDGILMDLGPSAPQLESGERGFSFYRRGPLDMRMDRNQSLRAEDILQTFSKKELLQIFKEDGEIRNPEPVIQSLLKERVKKPLKNAEDWTRIILRHNRLQRGKPHPATAYFLALRIQVNNELEGLRSCLPLYRDHLSAGGRLAILSFHSLEDRIVKQVFRSYVKEGRGSLGSKKAVRPSREEIKRNPRSRSAKLRVFVRNAAAELSSG